MNFYLYPNFDKSKYLQDINTDRLVFLNKSGRSSGVPIQQTTTELSLSTNLTLISQTEHIIKSIRKQLIASL